jgi:hypothetical protein
MYGSYNKDITHVLLERDNFNLDSNNNTNTNKTLRSSRTSRSSRSSRSLKDPYKNQFGEITGKSLNIDTEPSKGMPLRPECTFNRTIYDNNDHLDFNLYDIDIDKTKTKMNTIQYNDPDNTELCSINKTSYTLTDNITTEKVCIDSINAITFRLYNTIVKKDILSCINGLGIYLGFLSLYYGSTGNTEIELKSFFNFVGRKKTYECINNLIKYIAKDIYLQATFRTYILYDSEMKISSRYKKKSIMVPLISINSNNKNNKNIELEKNRINSLIYNETGSINLMSSNTLNKVELSVLCVIRINPIWSIKPNLTTGKFMNEPTIFMNFKDCNIGYYEECNGDDIKILEIPMEGNKMVFGIILCKNPDLIDDTNDTNDTLESKYKNIKLFNIHNLSIPKIVKRTKMRLNTTLKTCGLNACFLQTELPDIFPNIDDDNGISDVLQYCDLILDEKYSNIKLKNKNKNKNNVKNKIKSIIINDNFIYYVRYIPENLIICTGKVTI